MSIENPTLAHFRHFCSLFTNLPAYKAADIYVPIRHLYICRESSTNQLLFMQNKPNFQKSQMNVNPYNTSDYENKSNWTLGENKPNSNPIAERVKLMQSMYLQRIMKKNAAKGYERTNPKQTQSNPVLSAVEWTNFKGKKMLLDLSPCICYLSFY